MTSAPNHLDESVLADGPLTAGAQGDKVLALQMTLHYVGAVTSLNGAFDAETRAALEMFQADHGLPVTGVLDRADRDALLQARDALHEHLVGRLGDAAPEAPVFFGADDDACFVSDAKAIIRTEDGASTSRILPDGLECEVLERRGRRARVQAFEGEFSREPVWTNASNLSHLKNVSADLEPRAKVPLAGLGGDARRMAVIHNRYGGFLQRMAAADGYPVEGTAAVLAVESGGDGFNLDGTPVIRFENHLFKRQWKRDAVFAQHFTYRKDKVWLGHQVRFGTTGPFEDFHGNQKKEHKVLSFARSLDGGDEPALLSQSMGAVQVVGFNFMKLGYPDVQTMWVQQASGIGPQLEGFFSFVRNTTHSREGLKAKDYVRFAQGYNGPGQKDYYGGLIAKMAATYLEVTAGARAVSPSAPRPPAPPRPTPPPTPAGPSFSDTARRIRFLTGGVDGIFGEGTARATRAFQARHGLDADGIVGPATFAKAEGVTGAGLLKVGSRGEVVRAWQQHLADTTVLGDGSGSDARAATTRAVQILGGLPVTGVLDAATEAAAAKLV